MTENTLPSGAPQAQAKWGRVIRVNRHEPDTNRHWPAQRPTSRRRCLGGYRFLLLRWWRTRNDPGRQVTPSSLVGRLCPRRLAALSTHAVCDPADEPQHEADQRDSKQDDAADSDDTQ